VVSAIVKLVVRDEIAQRDRIMRDNLDAMAQKVGELQAKLLRLEAVGDRVSGMAGMKPEELKPLRQGTPMSGMSAQGGQAGQGGVYLPLDTPSFDQLQQLLSRMDQVSEQHADVFTLIESRLLEARLQSLVVPSTAPVAGEIGSGFGVRPDPITGRNALHSGLDFPAEPGTPIRAAAGGVVVSTEWHPQFGHLLELDHGKGLTTLYAHNSQVMVQRGDIVKRGQVVARVGNSGRSTGPHLHFEVLVDGVPQDPARFLAAGAQAAAQAPTAAAKGRARR
jgi:murein DD-endopeptidase MepM/ murein hydrolase activator NlpD